MAETFLNSSEDAAQEAEVIFADDFGDGDWYVAKGANSYLDDRNDGWEGEFFESGDETDTRAVQNGITGGSGWCLTSNLRVGTDYAAQHRLGPSTYTARAEIYHRCYIKYLSGYDWGHEKVFMYQTNFTGVDPQAQHVLMHHAFGSAEVSFLEMGAGSNQYDQNISALAFTAGKWYYLENHIKLNTTGQSDGVLETWIDDVGTDGLTPVVGGGTLRLQYTGISTLRNHATGIGSYHEEHWGDHTSLGKSTGELYVAQIIFSTARIGPADFSGGGGSAPRGSGLTGLG